MQRAQHKKTGSLLSVDKTHGFHPTRVRSCEFDSLLLEFGLQISFYVVYVDHCKISNKGTFTESLMGRANMLSRNNR